MILYNWITQLVVCFILHSEQLGHLRNELPIGVFYNQNFLVQPFMLSTAFGLITNIAKPHGSVVPLILLVSDHPKITRDLPLKRARYASNQCSIIDLINTLLVQWHKVN